MMVCRPHIPAMIITWQVHSRLQDAQPAAGMLSLQTHCNLCFTVLLATFERVDRYLLFAALGALLLESLSLAHCCSCLHASAWSVIE
jgi:hypothetical protein